MATQMQGTGVTVLAPEVLLPPFYRPPLGLPLYWGDETSGALPAAVGAYIGASVGGPEPSAVQLRMLCGYCRYYIHAPCWADNCERAGCPEDLATVLELRERSKSLASFESIRRWCEECMELGLDPF